MRSPKHENTRARRQALQALYSDEICGQSPLDPSCGDAKRADASRLLLITYCPDGSDETELVGETPRPYARVLFEGVRAHIPQIDAWISQTATNWTLDRMPLVDRNIIRIAVFEIAFCNDIPTGVAINEAVEMAKAFGGDESPKFVNGVLGRIADMIENGAKDLRVAEQAAWSALIGSHSRSSMLTHATHDDLGWSSNAHELTSAHPSARAQESCVSDEEAFSNPAVTVQRSDDGVERRDLLAALQSAQDALEEAEHAG